MSLFPMPWASLFAAALIAFGLATSDAVAQREAAGPRGAALSSENDISLQTRVNALAQQLRWRYAGDIVGRHEQRRRLEGVLEAWNAVGSPTEADRQRLVAWLDAATRATMPGASGRFPSAPTFVGARFGGGVRRHGVSKHAAGDGPTPRSEWSRHPAAAPLEWVDPFKDDSDQTPDAPDRGAVRHQSLRPILGEASGVSVDLVRLTERFREYNATLRELSRELALAVDIDVVELQQVTEQLARLQAERRLLTLYRQNLSEEERVVLPPSPPMGVAHEIAKRATEDRLARLPEDRLEERVRLERLRERLASLQ